MEERNEKIGMIMANYAELQKRDDGESNALIKMEESNKKRIAIIGADHPANINSLLAAAGDVGIVDINNIPEDFGLLYTKEALQHAEMIKEYEAIQYSHLSKKEREADIQPIRNSKDNPKIGRNELCPCGSGKKYKKCCALANER